MKLQELLVGEFAYDLANFDAATVDAAVEKLKQPLPKQAAKPAKPIAAKDERESAYMKRCGEYAAVLEVWETEEAERLTKVAEVRAHNSNIQQAYWEWAWSNLDSRFDQAKVEAFKSELDVKNPLGLLKLIADLNGLLAV